MNSRTAHLSLCKFQQKRCRDDFMIILNISPPTSASLQSPLTPLLSALYFPAVATTFNRWSQRFHIIKSLKSKFANLSRLAFGPVARIGIERHNVFQYGGRINNTAQKIFLPFVQGEIALRCDLVGVTNDHQIDIDHAEWSKAGRWEG